MARPNSYWELVEPHWGVVSIYDGPEAFLSGFAAMSEASRHLFAAHWLQSEVCNGGFGQFFGNSTGVLAPEAAAGFRAIGLPRLAAIVDEAIAWFGDVYPREWDVRQAALETFEEAHGYGHGSDCPRCSIEDRFYNLMANEAGGFDTAADTFAALAVQANS